MEDQGKYKSEQGGFYNREVMFCTDDTALVKYIPRQRHGGRSHLSGLHRTRLLVEN